MTTTTTTTNRVTTGRGPALRRFGALVRTETTILLRNRTAVFTAVALPLFMTFAFSGMDIGGAGLGALLATMLVVSSLMFVVYYTLVTSLVGRREQLVLKRLLAGEPDPIEILIAPAVPLWALLVIQSALGVGAALLLGAPLPNPWALALAVVAGAAAWTALAVASAALTRTVEAAQLTTLPLILLSLLFSGFSVPLGALPGPVQTLAHLLPMTPVVDLVRLAFTGVGADGRAVAGGADALLAAGAMVLPLLGWTALAMWGGLRWFRWEQRS
ncbi:ABC transporter permease [Micropruina sonneratiae]|uniref:ABC transporter permease n=1 Tax=Micropruina sonneratiae TaxID=2986940 RepID=UPI00222711EE|nr:ABC transporter permease [Micropruina sp. KQZ13P-5]MCW3158216.1 ABC transporter permease [Micropruina sp. KQZ13P-5]